MRRIVRVTALTLVAALVTVMVPSAPAAGAPGDTVGTITEFDFPTPGGSASVAPGPDGNMWFTKGSANQIGRITVPHDQGRLRGQGGGSIHEITVPTPGSEPSDIVAGPDGAIWFTEFRASQIGRLDPATGTISELTIPTPGSVPHGIAALKSGVWFTEIEGEALGRVEVCGSNPGRARVNGVAVCVPAGG